MTFEQLWERYTVGNPHWLTDGANLTPDGIRKLVKQAYGVGHKQGVENGRALAEMEAEKDRKRGGSIFDGLFKRSPF